MRKSLAVLTLSMAFHLCAAGASPNVVLIMVDDMGYSDLGCFGSEIRTPNIDRLAANGLLFTQFTNNAKCETTRTALMTGRYHPEARSGKDSVTIPEVLAPAGYQSFMVGKWHIFDRPETRGFDRWFGLAGGMANFFTGICRGRNDLHEDGELIQPPEDYYATDAFTDSAIRYVKEREKSKPFFLYVAHTAPHYPLQAPEEDVMKYRGRYRDGWHVLRERRFAGLKKAGILPADYKLSEHSQQPWEDLSEEEKDRQDLLMATYAAMIEIVDRNVGRLMDTLKEEGIFDNTLVLFLSDNGACPFDRTTTATREKKLMPWDPASFHCYTESWANACNTPFRLYKQNQHEGGVSTPLIAHWPEGIRNPGRQDRDRGHLVDIHATLRELAEVPYPEAFEGRTIGPARGLSLAPTFRGEKREIHDEIFYEFGGKYSALWTPEWKLVNGTELYRPAEDRIESSDLSDKHPEQVKRMQIRWKKIAADMGLRPKKKKK